MPQLTLESLKAALDAGHRVFHYEPNCDHTITQAGSVFEHHYEAKVVGNLKLWKSQPQRFELPVRAGSWNTMYITPENILNFKLPDECEDRLAAIAHRKERARTHEEGGIA